VKPNITVSYGLRYESQNNIGDHADFAPAHRFAWASMEAARIAKDACLVAAGFACSTIDLRMIRRHAQRAHHGAFRRRHPSLAPGDTDARRKIGVVANVV